MNKSILVLEENSVVHGLIASALDLDGLTLHHEFNPARFVERARALTPDLILLSNTDQGNQYSILRKLKTQASLSRVPVLLLANSRDRVEGSVLRDLGVGGVIRKPFEASDVQQAVSKHLDLIDLVGPAYEYRQSQSTREDIPNPLAQLDVLEDDVPELWRRSTAQPEEPAPAAPAAVRAAAGTTAGPLAATDITSQELAATELAGLDTASLDMAAE
ncbi:MAG TPA: hypothetical protein VL359_04585, partial [bacterium]|nr:hypothetical protein [bacterium]